MNFLASIYQPISDHLGTLCPPLFFGGGVKVPLPLGPEGLKLCEIIALGIQIILHQKKKKSIFHPIRTAPLLILYSAASPLRIWEIVGQYMETLLSKKYKVENLDKLR